MTPGLTPFPATSTSRGCASGERPAPRHTQSRTADWQSTKGQVTAVPSPGQPAGTAVHSPSPVPASGRGLQSPVPPVPGHEGLKTAKNDLKWPKSGHQEVLMHEKRSFKDLISTSCRFYAFMTRFESILRSTLGRKQLLSRDCSAQSYSVPASGRGLQSAVPAQSRPPAGTAVPSPGAPRPDCSPVRSPGGTVCVLGRKPLCCHRWGCGRRTLGTPSTLYTYTAQGRGHLPVPAPLSNPLPASRSPAAQTRRTHTTTDAKCGQVSRAPSAVTSTRIARARARSAAVWAQRDESGWHETSLARCCI